ncbi:MAG: LuxR C-terminal-related transcriptional regulator [Muribaculaceae bacterium]|nr:LuxR C-terminal-related transcriptional regulator [Muribaculaceae bacterium]
MKKIILFLTVVAVVLAACSRTERHRLILSQAESIVNAHPDSALALLEAIDPADFTHDSVKAKYYFVLASAHDGGNGNIALSDSMISFSNDYYKGKDLKRSVLSATLLASYKFRIGERETSLSMLDSLLSLKNVPESLLIEPLRSRVGLWAYEGNHTARIKRLIALDKDEDRQHEYKFWLYFSYLFYDKPDSALLVMDDLTDMAARFGDNRLYNQYRYEKMGVLTELGRYQELLNIADTLLNLPDEDSGAPYFRLWKSLGLLNMRKYSDAASELAIADSLATDLEQGSQAYFTAFSTVLHTVLDFYHSGKVSLLSFARVNNPQRDNLINEHSMRQEAAKQALETENKRLIIQSQSDRQKALLIIIILAALIVSGALIWYALNKKRKSAEVLERNEILQKLVDESKSIKADASVNDKLRKAMLQQLGIIKIVAETPTEQNREMLRKLSSIESDTAGALVNWKNVYEIIDNLYSGFYTRLHVSYGNVLSDKEEQIIVLMMAGFSTKEISVITSQTMATVYTRKSTIRRKLHVPEKEDIVAFIRQGQTY